MLWDGSWVVHRLTLDRSLDFEWGVFYLPPVTAETSRFGPGLEHPMCVIGGAAVQFSVTKRAYSDTGTPETSERLRRVIQFLQFITLPENAEHITNETAQMIPNIVGVPARPRMQPFAEFLERQYTTTKFTYTFDLRFHDIMERMLTLYLNGGCDDETFFSTLDYYMQQTMDRAIQRKEPDIDRLERRWQELAPLRVGMKELPDGPR